MTLCDRPYCSNPKPPGPGRRYCEPCKEATRRKPRPVCSIEGCTRPVQARGWCHTHYEHNRKYGTPEARTLLDRFFEKVDLEPEVVAAIRDCWQWNAAATPTGYGQVSVDGQHRYAHRVVYELLIGPIPDGLQIDHLCLNKGCVNPFHIEPVTSAENTRRHFDGRERTLR